MKRKLTKLGKIVFTIITLLISLLVYSKLDTLGMLGRTNDIYLGLCLAGWFWIVYGQLLVLEKIWED